MAHLQSKVRSIDSSFQSSGMLIGDEEAASHWALGRLLGALTCPRLDAHLHALVAVLVGPFPIARPTSPTVHTGNPAVGS